jgi:hypothetical protein
MSGRSRSRTPSARARGAAYQAAKTAKGAQITSREKQADRQRDLIVAVSADQSRVQAGRVRVIYVTGAGGKEYTKIIERVAQKHAANGTRLRPFQRVYRGHALRTVGGLMQDDVIRWKGRFVGKQAHNTAMDKFRAMPAADKRLFLANAAAPRRSSRRRSTPARLGFGGAPAGGDSDGESVGSDVGESVGSDVGDDVGSDVGF